MTPNNPMTEGEALAVLRRLKDALPDVGLNGWMEGVHAVDVAISVLTAHTAASGGEAKGDRLAIRMLVAAGFVTEAKANEALCIAHGFEHGPVAPPPSAVPAEALRDELTRLRQMTCKCVENNTRMNASESRTKGLAQAAQRLLGSLSPGLPLNHKARAAVRELAALIPKGADHG